jgi:membrane-associated protease RseP (regulator of RpoE activity)
MRIRFRGKEFPRKRDIYRKPLTIHIALFVITACTTTLVGALQVNETFDGWLLFFLRGWVFSVPLLAILFAHEMGHYLTGRRHGLNLTLPYFLPGLPPFGTFGAFIKIRSALYDRNVLMQVGAAGPIAGSIVAVPLLALGLFLSRVDSGPPPSEGWSFGSSLILEFLCWIRFGSISSDLNIVLHPTAVAAWFGLLVTAVNLLPIGQLDGGHVVYALFGPRWARIVSIVMFCGLVPLGLMVCEAWLGFVVVVFIVGLRHPPPLDPYAPLSRQGRILGIAAIVLFFLTFIPAPITLLN